MKSLHALHFSVLTKEAAFGFDSDFLANMLKDDLVDFFASSELIKTEDILAEVETLEPLDKFSIVMYQTKITIPKKSDKIFSYILSKLSDSDRDFLNNTIETRVDDACNCYLRFDKNEFVENKKLVLVDHGNCIHLRVKVAAFPAKQENALQVMKEVLN